jgi:methionyl-tRNA synthetase
MTDHKTDNKRYYITTPIYYVNGAPHVGSATTTLLADATKRYRKLRGDDPFFLTGTDEHAQKVADAAREAGKDPQAFVDEVSQRFVETWRFLHCDYDDFIRTSEPRHQRVVQEVFRRLQASGDVYGGEYEGWYSVSDETFYRDSDVDENGIVKETGARVERVKEEVHYFRLSAYGDRLRAHIEANPDFLLPDTRRNEVLAFIDQGLRDIAISRRSTGWGIPVPGDESKVIYVWFDALINYLTETGWPDNPDYHRLWPCDAHLMAKEIYTRFHATLWPAMLMGLGLPLPRHVVGHGWWTVSGEKGSKSKGNIPSAESVVALLEERSGAPQNICVDALRYYLLRDISFTGDAEFSTDSLLRRYNADLANDLGNVLNRVLRAKYFPGHIPDPGPQPASGNDAETRALIESAQTAVRHYEAALEHINWGSALDAAFQLVGATNKYLDEKKPWILAKNGDTQTMAAVLYNALEATRIAALLVSPALPNAAREMAQQLGVPDLLADNTWSTATRWGGLRPGAPTGDAQPLFPRIDTKAATAQSQPAAAKPKDKPAVTDTFNTAAPTTPTDTITIDDFARVQLRVADILSAERVEGAKKLLRLQIRVGENDERQLVAGIAETYAPEELPGKKIVVVANLQPATIRGVQSQGMLLAATDEQGRAILLTPEKPVVAGATVR